MAQPKREDSIPTGDKTQAESSPTEASAQLEPLTPAPSVPPISGSTPETQPQEATNPESVPQANPVTPPNTEKEEPRSSIPKLIVDGGEGQRIISAETVKENSQPCVWCTYYMVAFPSSENPATDAVLGQGVVCARFKDEKEVCPDGYRLLPCLRCRYHNPPRECQPVPEIVLGTVLEMVEEHKRYVEERYDEDSEQGFNRVAKKLQLLIAPALRDYFSVGGVFDLNRGLIDGVGPVRPLGEEEAAQIVGEVEARVGPIWPVPEIMVTDTEMTADGEGEGGEDVEKSDTPGMEDGDVDDDFDDFINYSGTEESGDLDGDQELDDISAELTGSVDGQEGEEHDANPSSPTPGTERRLGDNDDQKEVNNPDITNTQNDDVRNDQEARDLPIRSKLPTPAPTQIPVQAPVAMVPNPQPPVSSTVGHPQAPWGTMLHVDLQPQATTRSSRSNASLGGRSPISFVGLLGEYYVETETDLPIPMTPEEQHDMETMEEPSDSRFLMSGALPPDDMDVENEVTVVGDGIPQPQYNTNQINEPGDSRFLMSGALPPDDMDVENEVTVVGDGISQDTGNANQGIVPIQLQGNTTSAQDTDADPIEEILPLDDPHIKLSEDFVAQYLELSYFNRGLG